MKLRPWTGEGLCVAYVKVHMSGWQAAHGTQPKNLLNVCFTGWREGWLAESREPLLIICPNKRFQLMSPQPEPIYITYSNKSDRAEHCSTELLPQAKKRAHTHRRAPTDTCSTNKRELSLTHTTHTQGEKYCLFDQIDHQDKKLEVSVDRDSRLSNVDGTRYTGEMLDRCLSSAHVYWQESPGLTLAVRMLQSEAVQRHEWKMLQNQPRRQLNFKPSFHMHGVRGSCSDHYNKDSY